MSATSNSLLSHTLSQSLIKPRRLSQSPISLSLSVPRSLSLQSNQRSSSIAFSSLDGLNNTNQDIPIEKRMFSLAFLFSHNKSSFEKNKKIKTFFLIYFAEYPAFPAVIDINQIREILPHRWVFLKQLFVCVFYVSRFLCFRMLFLFGVVGFRFCSWIE
jgi:hypothetical protein